MDVGGEAKERHEEATASSREFETTEVKVRCWQTEEGPLVNCTLSRGPAVVELDILANAKKARIPRRSSAASRSRGVLLGYRMRTVDHR